MKKFIKIFGIIVLLIILFRAWIYRATINYTAIGERKTKTLTNEKLKAEINQEIKGKELSLNSIAEIANKITKRKLTFSTGKVSTNPNVLANSGKSNCIGYSALFNSISNYLITKQHLNKDFETKHLIGELDFLGINLHNFFENPFYKNHDFNLIKNKKTGETIYIDPSLSDYFFIDRIHSENQNKTQ